MMPEMAPGEIERTLQRIERMIAQQSAETNLRFDTLAQDIRDRSHRLTQELTTIAGKVSEHNVIINRLEADINKLGEKHERQALVAAEERKELRTVDDTLRDRIEQVKVRAAWQSGAAAALAGVAGFIPWPWKHP